MSLAQRPILVIIRGVPGSGKSFFASKLETALQENEILSLDPDATDYTSKEYRLHVHKQQAEGVNEKLFPYRFLRQQAFDATLQRKIIIWNQPFTDLTILKKVTDKLQEFASENNIVLPTLVIEIETPKKVAWRRVQERKNSGGHGPSEEKFNKFIEDYESARKNNYQTVTIDGLKHPDEFIQLVVTKIDELRSS